MTRKVISGSIALLFLLTLMSTPVSGASVSGNGLKVSPVRTDLILDPGKSATVTLDITNITKTNATFEAVINNFEANGTSGTPTLITAGSPYSIQKFISPIPNITVGPGKSQAVNVLIHIPVDTSGGGYFGAVRFIAISPSSGKTLNIAARVASLILIRVNGPQLNDQLGLTSFSVSQNGNTGGFFFSGSNLVATAIFTNTGNVQTAPFGKINVNNTSGKQVMTASINNVNPPGNVLPDSARAFSVQLQHIGSFGEYTVYGNFGYGSKGQLLSGKTTFYVVAPWIIVLAAIILVFLISLIWLLPKFFRYWYRRSIRNIR